VCEEVVVPGSFLPEFELYVSLAVARLGDGAYGAAVRQEIESRVERPVSVGALYTTMARLEEKGLLASQPVEPEPGQRGRPRKYYNLTEAGQEAVRHSLAMLGRMAEGLALADPGRV
jgi:DNA-binding PadR family transcriptional regulator